MIVAIVPAYNEAHSIGSVIRGLFHHVDRVLVVNDGSTDDTANVARAAGATVLSHEVNRGQGAALETGHTWARMHCASHVLHFDADGQFDAEDVSKAISLMNEHGADVVLGSRFLHNDATSLPLSKRVLLPIWRELMQNALYGVELTDAHNGFRLLNERALHRVSISQDGMAHASEIIAQCVHHKLEIVELPIVVTYHEYGQGIGGAMRIFRDLFIGKFV